jgi:hypothetical protein
MDENEERIAHGTQFAEFVWWSLAKRIVLLAGEFYKWNDDEWQIAKDIFLRSNDYAVVPS